MGGREQGYYGPSDADIGSGALALGALLLLGVALIVALGIVSVEGDSGDARCVVGSCECEEADRNEA